MTDLLILLGTAGAIAGFGILVAAAAHDVVARTVPNQMSLLIAACGLAAQLARAVLGGGGLPGFGLSLLASLVVFIVAALMWRRGWMGGGDVKLLAAAALLVPPGLVLTLVMATAISGSVLSLFYLAARRRLPRPRPGRPPSLVARIVRVERWRLHRGGPLPYAVAIASGACFVLSLGVST